MRLVPTGGIIVSLLNNKMRLGAVSLEVTSLENTVPFYRDVLGLERFL